MTTAPNRDLSPRIVIGETDHNTLSQLANAGLDRTPELAETLLDELERAKVVADTKLPDDVARMGSRIVYATDGAAEQVVTLVYPADADIAEGKISVMTPIGTALIGLKAGQSITWRNRADKRQKLTVVSVDTPQAG